MARTPRPQKPIQTPEEFRDIRFPCAGVDLSYAFSKQPNRQVREDWARTTPLGVNVRAYEPSTDRMRGGSRPGIHKQIAGQVSGTNPLQEICSVVVADGPLPGTGSIVTTMLGAMGQWSASGAYTSLALASSNSNGTLQIDTATALTFPTWPPSAGTTTASYSGAGISVRAILSGSPNQSYSVNGIADGLAVTVGVGVCTVASAPTAVLTANGKRITTTTLPGTFDVNMVTALASSSYHIVFGIQTGKAIGACALDDSGAIVWSNMSVGTANEDPANLGAVDGVQVCAAISGSYLCGYLPTTTGAVRCDLATGNNYALLKSASAIGTQAGGNYKASCLLGRQGAQGMATASNVMAVTVCDPTTGNCGLVFIQPSTGNFLYTPLLGLNTSPTTTPAMGYPQAVVVSDGTNFYCCMTDGQTSSTANTNLSVVTKVKGSDGSVLWTQSVSSLASGGRLLLGYLSGLGSLQIYGTGWVPVSGRSGSTNTP